MFCLDPVFCDVILIKEQTPSYKALYHIGYTGTARNNHSEAAI